MMDIEFSGSIAFVTGGTKGIGREIALSIARCGAKVVVNYAKDKLAAKSFLEEIKTRRLDESIIVIRSDVSKRDSLKTIIGTVADKWNSDINLLVNNAGILNQGDFFQLSEESWDKTFAVNLKGPFFLCQQLMPIMSRNGGGAIVNIASIGGQTGGEKAPDYAATKGGLITFTHSMARIGARMGIRVNAVSPGWIKTDIFTPAKLKQLSSEAKKVIPLMRLGAPEEVADAVLFLLSDNASYITGQTLNVNGGMFLN